MTTFAICCYSSRDGGTPPPALFAFIIGGWAVIYGLSRILNAYKARREPDGIVTDLPRPALLALGLGSVIFLIGGFGLIHG